MRVVLFAGPTGGHFYPALAFAESLKEKHPESDVLIVTGERGRSLAEKAGARLPAGQAGHAVPLLTNAIQFEYLPDFPFPRPNHLNFFVRLGPFLIRLARAFMKSRKCCRNSDRIWPWVLGVMSARQGFGSVKGGEFLF